MTGVEVGLDALSGIGLGASAYEDISGEEAQRQALREEGQEEQISADQEASQRTQKLLDTMGMNAVTEAAHGQPDTSGAYQDLTFGNLADYDQDQQLAKLDLNLHEDQIQSDINQSDAAEGAGIMGDAFQFGDNSMNLMAFQHSTPNNDVQDTEDPYSITNFNRYNGLKFDPNLMES